MNLPYKTEELYRREIRDIVLAIIRKEEGDPNGNKKGGG